MALHVLALSPSVSRQWRNVVLVLHPPIIPDIPTVVLSELFTDVSGSIVCPNCAMAYSVLAGCGSEPSRSRLENYPERTKGTLPLRRPSLGRLFHLRSIAAVKLVTVRRTAAADTSSRRVSPVPPRSLNLMEEAKAT